MLGLYVHVPFCSAICNYCNFNRGLFDAGLKARYVDALIGEITRAGRPGGSGRSGGSGGSGGSGEPGGSGGSGGPGGAGGNDADTIFFGGGTPSLLEPGEIGRIVDACRQA